MKRHKNKKRGGRGKREDVEFSIIHGGKKGKKKGTPGQGGGEKGVFLV